MRTEKNRRRIVETFGEGRPSMVGKGGVNGWGEGQSCYIVKGSGVANFLAD
jgi:hypothetical protein